MRHALALAGLAAFAAVLACSGEAPEPEAPESAAAADSDDCCTVTIRAIVPEGTGTLYVAGSLPELGPWDPDAFAMSGGGVERVAEVRAPRGATVEYKFTLGSWPEEAVEADGRVPGNHVIVVDGDVEATHEIPAFRNVDALIENVEGSGVVGRLIYWKDVESEYLGPARHVSVWLPPGYDPDGEARYPVLYMSDGQNLFDPRIANTGVDWGVDEAITSLAEDGAIPPVIVVSTWSTGDRGPEYSPWHGAPRYARFLIEELMPRVNEEYRTATGPENTVHMGSSMGGLLSFYLVTNHPDVFGACGCLSTHFPLSEAQWGEVLGEETGEEPDETPFILRDIEAGLTVPDGVRYWFDYGTEGLDASYGPPHQAVREWLLSQGLVEGEDFVMREYPGADHNEASWRARLDDPLVFLFGNSTP